MKNFEITIEVNNREMTLSDLETNEVQNYKKENKLKNTKTVIAS